MVIANKASKNFVVDSVWNVDVTFGRTKNESFQEFLADASKACIDTINESFHFNEAMVYSLFSEGLGR